MSSWSKAEKAGVAKVAEPDSGADWWRKIWAKKPFVAASADWEKKSSRAAILLGEGNWWSSKEELKWRENQRRKDS